jgi:hypothetical protein
VKSGRLDVESGHLRVGDFDALHIVTFIQATGDGEPGVRGGAGDQLDNDQVADQRLATPVLGDEGKQPMILAPNIPQKWRSEIDHFVALGVRY